MGQHTAAVTRPSKTLTEGEIALDVGDLTDEAGRVRRNVRLRVCKRSSEERAHQEIVLSDTVRAKLENLLRGRRDEDSDFGLTSPVVISRLGRQHSSLQSRFRQGGRNGPQPDGGRLLTRGGRATTCGLGTRTGGENRVL